MNSENVIKPSNHSYSTTSIFLLTYTNYFIVSYQYLYLLLFQDILDSTLSQALLSLILNFYYESYSYLSVPMPMCPSAILFAPLHPLALPPVHTTETFVCPRFYFFPVCECPPAILCVSSLVTLAAPLTLTESYSYLCTPVLISSHCSYTYCYQDNILVLNPYVYYE